MAAEKYNIDGHFQELKLKKTRLKTSFTKTKNKILYLVSEESFDKKELHIYQDRLDTNLDELMNIFEEIYEVYKETSAPEQVKLDQITTEMEKVDQDYSETYLMVREALENLNISESTSRLEIEKDMWKNLRRVGIPIFDGNKSKYEPWKAAFTACVDNSPTTSEYKLLQLRQYVEGEALKAIEDLGHSPEAYKAAKERLERKFGGQRRKVMKFMELIDNFQQMNNEDAKQLDKFADMLDLVVINLKQLGREEDLGDGSLYLSLQKKMPETMLSRFHRWLNETAETESVETLRNWVIQESTYLTIAAETKHGLKQKSEKGKRAHAYFGDSKDKDKSNTISCKLCNNASHKIWECQQFKQLDVNGRWKKAKELRLCFRCLRDNHIGNQCKNFRKCSVNGCLKTHNTLLHQVDRGNSNLRANADEFRPGNNSSRLQDNAQQSFFNSKSKVALRTVPVILTAHGKRMRVNALLDDGSTKTYVSRDVAAGLGLNSKIEHVTVNVLSGKIETFETMTVNLNIESLNGQNSLNIEAFVIDTVTGSLQTIDWRQRSRKYPHLQGIQFPIVKDTNHIDILIGLDYAQLHTSIYEVSGQPGEPIARLTPLGWTCVGKLEEYEHSSLFSTYFVTEDFELNDIMKNFWDIDSSGVYSNLKPLSHHDKNILDHMDTTTKFKDGRYEISVPWKCEPNLPNNREMALKRLTQTEKKIHKNPEVESRYGETINKYLEKGYIRKVETKEIQSSSRWYLPHFPVVDLNRETTKVRIVCDASAKYQGVCLNDYIHQGPKLQNDLFEILLRFRKNEVAIICDISEMYLQVGICEADRKYHSILWDNSEYEFTRLVFGVNASPFLAQYVSQRNAKMYADKFPMAAETILKSTYMDDSMDSCCSEKDGIELYKQLSQLWSKAGMYARKWLSNSIKVMEMVPKEDRALEVDLDVGYLPITKTLGVIWKTEEDLFTFKIKKDKEKPAQDCG